MRQYLNLLQHVRDNGRVKEDRTGTGTISVFGTQTRYDLTNGKLPLVTTKKVHLKSVIRELLWMLSGSTNVKALQEHGVTIWDEWAAADGNLGPVYGQMWRKFPNLHKVGFGVREDYVDQIQELEHELTVNPTSRRLLITGWHPGLLPDSSLAPNQNAAAGKQALPPCHTLFQFICEPMTIEERVQWHNANVGTPLMEIGSGENAEQACDRQNVPKYFLSCQLYQRSADLFLGVPFNIASYSILTHMLANVHGFAAREFIHTIGDAHIYSNHFEQVETQLKREPFESPTIVFDINPSLPPVSILDLDYGQIHVVDYEHHEAIKAKVAV